MRLACVALLGTRQNWLVYVYAYSLIYGELQQANASWSRWRLPSSWKGGVETSNLRILRAPPVFGQVRHDSQTVAARHLILLIPIFSHSRSQWPRGLRRRSAAARLLRLWVRIPPGAWMSVVSAACCQVEVFSTADHSSRGVLPTVVRRCVWSRPREWGGHGPLGGCRAKNNFLTYV